jgi:hypothetical protein
MDFINKIMTTYPGLLENVLALPEFTQDDKEFFRYLFQNAEKKTKDAILLALKKSKNPLKTVVSILRKVIRQRNQNPPPPVARDPPAPPPVDRPPVAPASGIGPGVGPPRPGPPASGVGPGVDPAFPPALFGPASGVARGPRGPRGPRGLPAAILVNPFVNGAIQINPPNPFVNGVIQINPPKTGPIVQMVRDETIDNINSQLDQFIQSIPTWNWAQTIKRNKNNKNKNQKTTRFIN